MHSSLESVGLTAKVSTKLAEHGISANIMAGYYHDHIFVPFGRASDAMAAIKELSENREWGSKSFLLDFHIWLSYFGFEKC